MKIRYCLIFQGDDSNATKIATAFDTYEEAFKALINEFRGEDDNSPDEEIMEFLEEIEVYPDLWSDNGKSWEICILYDN